MEGGGKRKKEEEGEEVTSSPTPFLSLPLGSDWPMGDRRSPSIGRLRRHPPVERHPCVFSPPPQRGDRRAIRRSRERKPPSSSIGGGGGKATSDRPFGSQGPRKGERAPPSAPGGGREGGRADHLILPRFVLLSSLPAPAPFSPQVAARRRRRRRRGERQVKGHCAAFSPLPQRERPIGPLLCLFPSPTLLSQFPISQERKGGCQYLHTGPHFCRRRAKALWFYRYSFVLDTMVFKRMDNSLVFLLRMACQQHVFLILLDLFRECI